MTDANDVAGRLEARANRSELLAGKAYAALALDRTAAALLRSLNERVKELEEALEPFARAAGDYDDDPADPKGYLTDNDEIAPMVGITINDLRAARRALKASQ